MAGGAEVGRRGVTVRAADVHQNIPGGGLRRLLLHGRLVVLLLLSGGSVGHSLLLLLVDVARELLELCEQQD